MENINTRNFFQIKNINMGSLFFYPITIFSISLFGSFMSYRLSMYNAEDGFKKILSVILKYASSAILLSMFCFDLIPHMGESNVKLLGLNVSMLLTIVSGIFLIILKLHIDNMGKRREEKEESHNDKEMVETTVLIDGDQKIDGKSAHIHNESHSHGSNSCCGQTKKNIIKKTVSEKGLGFGIIVLSAISIHSFFEGFLMSENVNIKVLLISMGGHKLLESIGVADIISGIKSEKKIVKLAFVIVSSLITPLGMVLRSIINTKHNETVIAIMNGIGFGATAYVLIGEMGIFVVDHIVSEKHPERPYINVFTKTLFWMSLIFLFSMALRHGEGECGHSH